MNGKRILGQVLLWAGFLSAALAAVSHREMDFLPPQETVSLLKLDKKLSLPEPKFEELVLSLGESTTSEEHEKNRIKHFDSDQLDSFVDRANLLYAEEKRLAEEARRIADEAKKAGKAAEEKPKDEKKKVRNIKTEDIINKRLANVENKWPTVPWLWYGLSMLIGVAGVVLLRSTSKSAEQETGRVAEEYSILTQSLDRLTSGVSELHGNLGKLAPAEIVHFIDDRLAEDFANFADARNSLTQMFGLDSFANIMTEFASAERFINRSWSAAADGYVDEVASSVARAQSHLKQANRLLAECDSKVK